jgi:hypothetical protein
MKLCNDEKAYLKYKKGEINFNSVDEEPDQSYFFEKRKNKQQLRRSSNDSFGEDSDFEEHQSSRLY